MGGDGFVFIEKNDTLTATTGIWAGGPLCKGYIDVGHGNLISAGELDIAWGNLSEATVDVGPGCTLKNHYTAAVGLGNASEGVVRLGNNASWTTAGVVIGSLEDESGHGRVFLANGAVLARPPAGSTSRIHYNGYLGGTGTANTDIVWDSGTICPGNTAPPVFPLRTVGGDVVGIGTLTVNGGVDMSSSRSLDIDIAGETTAGTDYDQLVVNGAATVGGNVTVHFRGYTPKEGDSFDIVASIQAITGRFNNKVLGDQLPPGLKWVFDYKSDLNMVTLRVVKAESKPVSAIEGIPFTNQAVAQLKGIGASLLPYLTAGINYDYHPGDSYTYVASAAGPNGCIVMDGDDAVAQGSYTYPSAGRRDVRVVFYADGQEVATVDTPINVGDAALTLTPISDLTAVEGQPVQTWLATFTDAAPDDSESYQATIDWGGGVVTPGLVTSNPVTHELVVSPAGMHTYAEEGPEVVHITLYDPDGATASTDVTIDVTEGLLTGPFGWGNNGPMPSDGQFSGLVATFIDPAGAESLSDYAATVTFTSQGYDPVTGTGVQIAYDSGRQQFRVTCSAQLAACQGWSITTTISHGTAAPVNIGAMLEMYEWEYGPLSDIGTEYVHEVGSGQNAHPVVEGQQFTATLATFADCAGPHSQRDYSLGRRLERRRPDTTRRGRDL